MVNVDKDDIKNASNNMLGCVEEFKNQISHFLDIANDIAEAWNGNSDANDCLNDMQKLYNENINTLYSEMLKYQIYLKNIPGLYDLLDEIYTSKKINI